MSRSQATPIQGVDAQFTLTEVIAGVPTGAPIVLWNSDWDITPSNKIAEAPNTTDGMIRAPGLNDYKGTVKGSTNTTVAGVVSNANAIESNAMPGQIFAFTGYRSKGSSTSWSGFIIMGDDLKITTGVGSLENWEFSFAKAYGYLTLPNGNTF
jgi:hypothetical protein